jgi:hypothetical protein
MQEQALLRAYLSRLGELGVQPLPKWDDAWHLYRAGPAWGFAMWAITPGEMYSDILVEAVLDRFASAFADLGTAEILT